MSDTPLCKICGARTGFFDRCDFHNNAKVHFGYYDLPLKPSGMTLEYFQCSMCGFLFTPHMDQWTGAEFAQQVYNRDYPRIDGTYNGYRAGALANILYLALGDYIPQLDFLDYGGGLGLQSAILKAFGAHSSLTYDPFAAGATRPTGSFNMVTSLEVLEHATDPKKTVADWVSLVNPDSGLVFFTTELLPPDIAQQKCRWWYVNPRVGHISFYTEPALQKLFAPHGMKLAHIEQHTHMAYRQWPVWADKLLPAQFRPGS